jgi:hypothetical protein
MSTKDIPKTKKGSKSKTVVVSYKDILASDTVRNREVDPSDLEETAASGSEGGYPISEGEISEEGERESTEVEEVQLKKKSRRDRSATITMEEAIRNSAEVEQQSSVREFSEFRAIIKQMAIDNAKIQEELTSIKNNSSVKSGSTNYGFFETVLLLESAADVTKTKVLAVISQMRNPNFQQPLREIIFLRARRVINFDFLQYGYAKSQEEIELWTDVEYIDMLEKFFQNVHLDATSLQRFSKIKMGGLFVTGKISQLLINSLLEADDLMSQEERVDMIFNKSLIQRAVSHLSPLEPARIKLTTEISKCRTFKEFLLLWTRYRNSKQVIVDELTADGYVVLPKSYILSAGSSNTDKPAKDKKEKFNQAERSASTLIKTLGTVKLDPKFETCNGCGRQEYDQKQKAAHSYSNCFLRLHPN